MFSFVYNHLKPIRVVFFFWPENEPFMSTEGASPLPQSLLCSTAMYIL